MFETLSPGRNERHEARHSRFSGALSKKCAAPNKRGYIITQRILLESVEIGLGPIKTWSLHLATPLKYLDACVGIKGNPPNPILPQAT